ncbi:prolipoprotein diacylglyceryl transferase family protein [Halomonas sp. GXIMD04776]|uniref:prolipoprotein diacylglyceryl transferase family protein n=1 Tax=Halomonas sp. GXIMD04776 TaxID=3415605 RepID=UPI003CA3AF4E
MSSIDQSFALGPLVMSLSQLLLIIACAIALLVGVLVATRHRVSIADTLINLFLVGVVVARLVFVARYFNEYDSLWAMLDIRDGGFSLVGGLVAALLYTLWRLWRVPQQRAALISAVLTGALVWGGAVGSLMLIDRQARPLPEVDLAALDGETTSLPALSEASGEPLVINLWATWCPPCRREMPMLEAAQRRESDVTFVFVNQGEGTTQVHDFLEEEALELNNLLLDRGGALGQAVGSQVMPTTLLYDAQGKLRETHYGELSRASLTAMLDKIR